MTAAGSGVAWILHIWPVYLLRLWDVLVPQLPLLDSTAKALVFKDDLKVF